jgi:hypothetical protein
MNPRFSVRLVFRAAVLAVFILYHAFAAGAAPENVMVGNVRVQPLSDSLVRIELKGPDGFEDRNTFHIVNRDWQGTKFLVQTNSGFVEIITTNYYVRVPQNADSLDGIKIFSASGAQVYRWDGKLENSKWLPSPGDKVQSWWFADSPRIIPPPWGLTPPPEGKGAADGGWDLSNNAPDIYVFIPQGNYFRLREDFLQLTGPTEMPPLFAFGAFDSRWYDYSETTALKQIDDYRARKIPLDVLVVDTGWRAGASTGYNENTNLFPNLPRFFSEAHAKNVKILFNDHPEPLDTNAPSLDAREIDFRFNGLSGLLQGGLDIWWYDRNWWVALVPPAPNLRKEAWGMKMYHDTTARVRPAERPLIMANVDGIDNGILNRPMNVASHRYPFQWTGDIGPDWSFLRRAVENAVYSGVQSLFPYESDDLGGHIANPTTEQYIRWIEYGSLSPVYRPHCTHNLERMPWTFGSEAETVARNYLNMRYRLLPVFYAAAHENYESGEPLLRRLDLEFPQFTESARNDEYLLGKDILVAPVLQGSMQTVPSDWLKASDSRLGLRGEYFANDNLAGAPTFSRNDSTINFNWDENSPAPDFPRTHFSSRWSGTIEIPAAIGDVKLATLEDDGARVWIDGTQVIDAWGGHASTTTEASGTLTAGTPHQIRVEYQQLDFGASIKLQWQPAKTLTASRVAWIPPGDWLDAWNGKIISGPAEITNEIHLDEIPVFIRAGAVIPLAPEMQFTGQKPWNPLTLDLYPSAAETNSAYIYEDDTHTTAYKRGEFRNTLVTVSADEANKKVRVEIGAAIGNFSGALTERSWILRIHPPKNWPENSEAVQASVNGVKVKSPVNRLARGENAMPFGEKSGAPDADIFEVSLPSSPVSKSQSVEIQFAP